MDKITLQKIYTDINGETETFAMYLDNERVAYGNFEGSRLVIDWTNEIVYHYKLINKGSDVKVYPIVCEMFDFNVIQYVQKYFADKNHLSLFVNKIVANEQDDRTAILNL